MEIVFKKVSRGDLKRLNGVINDDAVSRFLCLIPPAPMASTIEFFESMKKNGGHWYCVIVDGKIAGSISLSPNKKNQKNSHVATLGIAISPEYWGKGVGAKAIRFITNTARKIGIKRVELQVVKENARAISLYKRCGFAVEGVKSKDFKIGRRYHDGLLMAKILK